MNNTPRESTPDDVWKWINSIGGHGVWDAELCVVSLARTNVTDQDLACLVGLPEIQILDLSDTMITNAGLAHLLHLEELESLILINTRVTSRGIQAFHAKCPSIQIETEPPSGETINPFTGKPF